MQPDLSTLDISGDLRTAARTNWQESGWPGPRAEAWRFTRLDKVSAKDLVPAQPLATITASDSAGDGPNNGPNNGTGDGLAVAAQIKAHAIRIINGRVDPASIEGLPARVRVGKLADDATAQAAMAALAPAGHPVSNLSMAVMSCGLVLDVDGIVDTPLMLVFDGDDQRLSTHPVVLVRLARGARMTIAEWHQSSVGLSAPLMGIDIAAGARLDLVKVQAESTTTTHIAATGVHLHKDAVLAGFSLSLGGDLARLETHVSMQSEGADCQLSAVYLGRGRQHHDITTVLDHAIGHCTSDQVIRGVLDDRARGVYQGKVKVAKDAQKTDGQQMSRALLLSRKAEADAKPELEIYADDVICAHGATVGELDATQLFYLTSRGIPEAKARAMLIEAFLVDVIDRMEMDDFIPVLRTVAEGWMAQTGIADKTTISDQEGGNE